MATSHEKGTFFAVSYEAKYTDTPAFKYFVIAYAIVTVYGFLVLFLPPGSPIWRLVLALDLVGKNGNPRAAWLPVCGQVAKFCNQVTGALVAGFIALITYIILLLYSVYNLLNPLFEKA
uniref:CASP-like protein n=1 Tax=Salix viminalis TaxID=40686 RepID=A0A6N2L8U4_SALVM